MPCGGSARRWAAALPALGDTRRSRRGFRAHKGWRAFGVPLGLHSLSSFSGLTELLACWRWGRWGRSASER